MDTSCSVRGKRRATSACVGGEKFALQYPNSRIGFDISCYGFPPSSHPLFRSHSIRRNKSRRRLARWRSKNCPGQSRTPPSSGFLAKRVVVKRERSGAPRRRRDFKISRARARARDDGIITRTFPRTCKSIRAFTLPSPSLSPSPPRSATADLCGRSPGSLLMFVEATTS